MTIHEWGRTIPGGRVARLINGPAPSSRPAAQGRTWSVELAALGGFFVTDVHSPGDAVTAPWRTLRSLLDDLDPLDARVEFVRVTLAAGRQSVPARVAGSVVQLGMLARVLAPALAIVAMDLGAVSLEPDELWWQEDLGGAFALSIAPAPSMYWPGGVVDEFNAVFASRYGVPSAALWGNIASSANSAAGQLVRSRPSLASSAWRAADQVLADPRVEGGTLRAGMDFRRRSCCLIYQAAGTRAAVCGDCVLAG